MKSKGKTAMKRFFALVLALCFAFSSAACALDAEALQNNTRLKEILQESSIVWFTEGIAFAEMNGEGAHIIDQQGNIII